MVISHGSAPMVDLDPYLALRGDPSVVGILERCEGLSPSEILRLAVHYADDDPRERRRLAAAAVDRSSAPPAVRRLASDASAAVSAAATASGQRARLARLGLFEAPLAASDAVLSVVLGDQIDAGLASRLARPWTVLP